MPLKLRVLGISAFQGSGLPGFSRFACNPAGTPILILLMDKILHDPKDSKLWELWYIPYNG